MLKLNKSVRLVALFTAFMALLAGCGSQGPGRSAAPPSSAGVSATATPATTPERTAAPTATPPGLSLAGLKCVAAGYGYSLAVTKDGSLLAWGNYAGAIQGEQYPFDTEKIQVIDKDVVSVTASGNFCAAIKADGSLWVWGQNKAVCGEAGAPAPVKVLDGVASVSLGSSFALAVKADGTLWAWGDNQFGQLCDSAANPTISQPTEVMQGVKKAAAGNGFSLVLLNDSTLMGAGLNACGQLLNFSNKQESIHLDTNKKEAIQTVPVKLMDRIADIEAGSSHSLALDESGVLWGFGQNSQGQIGNNWDETNTELEPIYSQALCLVPVKIMDGVQSIFTSDSGSGAVKADGTLWLWGDNGNGQIGDGKFLNALVPKQILDGVAFASQSGTHTLAVKTDGSLWAWGHNSQGELGLGYCNFSLEYTKVADNVKQAVSNGHTTLIVKADGSLWGAGSNDYGQLASADLTAQPGFVQLMAGAAQADLSKNAAFCVKEDGTLWSWGNNLYGALGNGKLEEGKYAYSDEQGAYSNHKLPKNFRDIKTTPPRLHAPAQILDGVREIFADYWTTYAVRADDSLWGWGLNEYGYAFADKTEGNTATPALRVKDVRSMPHRYILTKTDGCLYTWGYATFDSSDYRKLVKSPVTDVAFAYASYGSILFVRSDGTLWAWGTFGTAKLDQPLQIAEHVRKLSVGSDTYLLMEDGTLYKILDYYLGDFLASAGGAIPSNVLNSKAVEKVMDGVADMCSDKSGSIGGESNSSFIIKKDGTLWAKGYNNYGQLGDGKAVFTPKQVSVTQ